MIRFHVISLFPETLRPYCETSILGKAQKKGLLEVRYYNPMDFTTPRTEGALPQRVDEKPYGGGPGMVIRIEPVMHAISHAIGKKRNVGFIHFKPRAESFTTSMAKSIARESLQRTGSIQDIVLLCGRYEGIDSRIEDMYPGRNISIGDYVLTGGEIPALVVIDSVARQLPGVLGDRESLEEERSTPASGKYYTRPVSIRKGKSDYRVPEVLLEGNHAKINEWRKGNK